MASLARTLIIAATVLQSMTILPVQAQRVPPANDGTMRILPIPEGTMTILPVDDKSEILPGTRPWSTAKTVHAIPDGIVTKLPIQEGIMTILPVKTSMAGTPSATEVPESTDADLSSKSTNDGKMSILPVKDIESSGFTTITRS